ncbi:MAG: hypothetical protein M3Y17_03965 [Actinomycetota bacterium]|nr:hypothetical protein [Actinomycetota bacterium]
MSATGREVGSRRRTGLALRLSFLAVVVALVGPARSSAAQQLAPVAYTAIDGHTETLVPWQGQNVSVLVEQGPTRDPVVMNEMVSAFDAAFGYYAATTGRVPAVAHSLNGRDEIAEVSSTCGAGCTYLGATGTEIEASYFEKNVYQEIASSGLYDQVLFYELGRSFWFWSPQLQFKSPDKDPVVTGFAVLMRFTSLAAAGVNGGPFNGTPFQTFASQVAALAGQYEANPSLTFAQTLAQAKSPGMYGGTDFWASLMMQLAARHGGQTFLNRFFQYVGRLPAASSTAGAVTNWLTAANYAACADLSSVLYTRWGFPHPDGSVTARPPASSIPEPSGMCTGGTAAPVLSALKVSPHTFKLVGRLVNANCVKPTTKNRGHKRCRRPVRLQISYKLDSSATVTFTLKRQDPGRNIKGQCVKPTKNNKKHKHCTRLIHVLETITGAGTAGANRLTFNGRVGGHKLGSGTYQLMATPSGGTPQTSKFKITR